MIGRGGLRIDIAREVMLPSARSVAKLAVAGAVRTAKVSAYIGKMVLNEGLAIAKEVKERRKKRRVEASLREEAKMKAKLVELKERLQKEEGEKGHPAHGSVYQDARGWYDGCGNPRGWVTTGTAAVHAFDAENREKRQEL